MSGRAVIVETVDPNVVRLRRDFVAKIGAEWDRAVVAIFDAGRHLVDAKACLPHGQFETMIRDDLRIDPRTARYLMTIASNEWIGDRVLNRKHVSDLPASWGTLAQIARLEPAECERLVSEGVISAKMERNDVVSYIKLCRRREKHAGLIAASERALAEIGRRQYAVGVFDPPWETEAYAESGMSRNQANHYPPMATKDICALPIGDMFLDDAALFLWVLNNKIEDGIEVLHTWGFRLITNWVWTKPGRMGTGYWGREAHELLFIGRKGDKVGPPVNVPRSQWDIEWRGHSVKPHEIYSFIADEYAGLPMVEGFGRVGHPKDARFDVWGNEAGHVDGVAPDCDPPAMAMGGQL